MKTIKTLLLLSLCFTLFNCSDDDKEDISLGSDSLIQTSWKGEIIREKDGKITRKGNVGIEFTTSQLGRFSIMFENESSNNPALFHFVYVLDKKIIAISTSLGYNEELDGNWFVVSYKKNTLILQRGTGSQGTDKDTMTLKNAI